MTGWTCPPTVISDTDLAACIKLVKGVSHRGNTKDFAKSSALQKIRDRMADNGWCTWYQKIGGTINACCFFQYLRQRSNNFALCLGFDKSVFPMNTDAECKSFLATVGGNGNGDGLLRDSIKNVLRAPFVYVVDMPQTAAAAHYSRARDNLFVYMQTSSPGSNWTMTLDASDTNVYFPFWGGSGLDLWKLTVS